MLGLCDIFTCLRVADQTYRNENPLSFYELSSIPRDIHRTQGRAGEALPLLDLAFFLSYLSKSRDKTKKTASFVFYSLKLPLPFLLHSSTFVQFICAKCPNCIKTLFILIVTSHTINCYCFPNFPVIF